MSRSVVVTMGGHFGQCDLYIVFGREVGVGHVAIKAMNFGLDRS